MGHQFKIAAFMLTMLPGIAAPVFAGMPSAGFSELASLRLQGISFFLVVLLLSAAAVQWIWNRLAKEFTRLPRLNYPRACGVVLLWGLLFVVVLTMISGARELMTPGAWAKQGATYQLTGETASPRAQPVANADSAQAFTLAARRLQLAELWQRLRKHADANEGRMPASPAESGIDDEFWTLPDVSGLRYVYVPGRTDADIGLPLAYEPQLFAGDPLVLLVGGEVVSLPRERIEQSREKLSHAP